ncbi:unnamed protein product [Ceutorhynchus assimilis]|uniref:RING-type E3 ubiquitin transferase n=1 Tax=Ceutorhynchus assimilis TaxID=467358 RepID=A0A9N9QI49_9CUCU|nr:unnamed protein product [Ceutorhynchus assimilis]
MYSDADETQFNQLVRVVEFEKNGQNCGFQLTRGKWDPYPWVSNVDENSVSSSAGLKTGDCLLEVNGEDVIGQKIAEIAELVKSKPDKVSLLLWNAGVDPRCSPEALCCGPIPNNLTRLSACMSTVLAFLECPVCLDTIPPPSYQCDNGHLICMRCRAKSERCPVCRLRLGRGRSLLSDQVYNAVIESFNLKDETTYMRSQKIQQIFKPKIWNKNIPNIKVTECQTNKFLSKIVGKSSSVDNLSSSTKFLSPSNIENLKVKSASSSEIFQADTPSVSRVGSMKRLSRRLNNGAAMDDSLTNISDFNSRPSSFHESFNVLHHQRSDENTSSFNNNELSYYCPFDSQCKASIKGANIIEHFQTSHTGPLVQYFGSGFQIAMKNLENEMCFIINNDINMFFVKIINKAQKKNEKSGDQYDSLIWCWYVGSKQASKNFELQLEVGTKDSENILLRVRSSALSLNSCSFFDVEDFSKGIFVSSKTIKAFENMDQIVLNISISSNDI